MTTPNVTSSTDSQMHNNIMAERSRDRPSMLATGRYPQWRSRFIRYVDTRPNGEALKKCILSAPYKHTTVLVQAVEATDDSPAIPEHTTVEIPINMSQENKAHFEAKKEAIHLILTGIGDEIYSTVDAYQTAQEIQMHNNIMAEHSRDRPPMLATGRYPQWRSRFLRYVDTRPNGEALKKCILSAPYKHTTVLVQAVEATDDSPAIPEHTTIEIPINMSQENKAHFEAKKEAIHLILTGIGDEIYSTQMNEMIRNNLTVAMMQVNVQFLQQL
nr:hypothetical protein [Tanacetum cinerariifolium]